jgi:hypothetical protein
LDDVKILMAVPRRGKAHPTPSSVRAGDEVAVKNG